MTIDSINFTYLFSTQSSVKNRFSSSSQSKIIKNHQRPSNIGFLFLVRLVQHRRHDLILMIWWTNLILPSHSFVPAQNKVLVSFSFCSFVTNFISGFRCQHVHMVCARSTFLLLLPLKICVPGAWQLNLFYTPIFAILKTMCLCLLLFVRRIIYNRGECMCKKLFFSAEIRFLVMLFD